MAKIINAANAYTDKDIKTIISHFYGVPRTMIELSIWCTNNQDNTFRYGYYIPKIGYRKPVCYQNDRGQLIILRPEEYFEEEYLIDEKEAKKTK
ncbi:MAG: hypothetical protein J6U54_02575 [Clostridiales bacterium]|nr:hypothetical protein [Clostridiales bacterium]